MKYQCVDVDQPNLYKEIFPYDSLPQVTFSDGHQLFPHDIWLTDTTLRDGQQSMRSFSTEQSVKIYDFLHRIDNNSGLIRQAEFFVYNESDRNALIKCLELGYEFPEVTTWIRASAKDFDLIKNLGVKETGMLMSCSDYHIFKKFHSTRSETMKNYLDIAEISLKNGIRPRCHLEDITRADFDGFVIPLVRNLKDLCASYGIPVKIRACDTLGLGLPFDGIEKPRSVAKIIRSLIDEGGLDSSELEWHGHNDAHLAVANSTAAWLNGAASVNTTLLGIGERCGNTPLEGMLFLHAQLTGEPTGVQLDLLNQTVEYFKRELNYEVHEKYPLMGKDFNTTKAGIHADGLLKDPEIYNSFNTQKILNRPIVIVVNQASGTAGIAGWINNYFHLQDEEKIDKHDIRVLEIKNWVDLEYQNGRSSNITNGELRNLTSKYFPEIIASRSTAIGYDLENNKEDYS